MEWQISPSADKKHHSQNQLAVTFEDICGHLRRGYFSECVES
jgi:hypothetical protein